ncbi:MAG TPA: hypothetical protein VGN90_14080 [Pyrinomonadaceae bacterium]|nr:hypothetical protein [Pyrinomonadaceae bacterium]
MTWIGIKKIAFIPVYRPNAAPPDQVPPDWKDQILRRIFNDPAPVTGADRSLRAWVRAASSGLADLEADVLSMETIDRQDVPADMLESQMGNTLRSQGFDHACIVMLGGIGAGTNAGFWSRFVMLENTGVWAMEIMHGLTGFADLYHFNNDVDPIERSIDTFDEMSAATLTHPTAYTKAAVGWLDPARIKHHTGRTVAYELNLIGLPQPTTNGRCSAVRIATDVPYMMVEARKKNDQFEAGLPATVNPAVRGIASEGVIVYRVQTTNPNGWRQNNRKPLYILTQTALKPGETATVDNGVVVTVTSEIPGGFVVRVHDPSQTLIDRTLEHGVALAAGPPAACVIPATGVEIIAYRDTAGHLHELWRDANGVTGTTDLTQSAGAPTAAGDPYALVDTTRQTIRLLYRSGDGKVFSVYWTTGPVGTDNLSGSAGAPNAAGNPVGYYVPAFDANHVIYRGGDGHLHELFWVGETTVAYGGNLTAGVSAPKAAGDPAAFAGGGGSNIVVYRATNNRILSIYWTEGPSGLDDLSGGAGTPPAAGDPVAYYTPHNDGYQVVYRGNDGHLYELYWLGAETVSGWDLTAAAGAPAATGKPTAYYSAATNTKHVMYRSADGRLHELWWIPGAGPLNPVDLTEFAGAPLATEGPLAFRVSGTNTNHVAYRGHDRHIYEIIW